MWRALLEGGGNIERVLVDTESHPNCEGVQRCLRAEYHIGRLRDTTT
jgi:hypothetical protein